MTALSVEDDSLKYINIPFDLKLISNSRRDKGHFNHTLLVIDDKRIMINGKILIPSEGGSNTF